MREYVRLCRGCVSPNWYLFAWGRFPRIEQICKANLPRLTTECLENFGAVKSCIRQESETSLVKALALDTHRLSRLRALNGGAIMLDWLQREKCSGRIIPDHALRWLEQEKIHVSDIAFILDRMSEQQVCNYLQRQKSGTRDSLRQIISTWRDYLSMGTSWESTPTMRSYTVSSCCASVTMNWWSSCGKENGTWKLPQQQESIGKLQVSAA